MSSVKVMILIDVSGGLKATKIVDMPAPPSVGMKLRLPGLERDLPVGSVLYDFASGQYMAEVHVRENDGSIPKGFPAIWEKYMSSLKADGWQVVDESRKPEATEPQTTGRRQGLRQAIDAHKAGRRQG